MNKWRWDPAPLSSHFTLWLTSGYTQLRCNTLQAFTPMKSVHLRARIRASVWGGRDLFIFICDCDVVSVYEDILSEKDRINVMLMTPVKIDHDMTWNTVYIVSFFCSDRNGFGRMNIGYGLAPIAVIDISLFIMDIVMWLLVHAGVQVKQCQ